jgi:hypothetical protein
VDDLEDFAGEAASAEDGNRAGHIHTP